MVWTCEKVRKEFQGSRKCKWSRGKLDWEIIWSIVRDDKWSKVREKVDLGEGCGKTF